MPHVLSERVWSVFKPICINDFDVNQRQKNNKAFIWIGSCSKYWTFFQWSVSYFGGFCKHLSIGMWEPFVFCWRLLQNSFAVVAVVNQVSHLRNIKERLHCQTLYRRSPSIVDPSSSTHGRPGVSFLLNMRNERVNPPIEGSYETRTNPNIRNLRFKLWYKFSRFGRRVSLSSDKASTCRCWRCLEWDLRAPFSDVE